MRNHHEAHRTSGRGLLILHKILPCSQVFGGFGAVRENDSRAK